MTGWGRGGTGTGRGGGRGGGGGGGGVWGSIRRCSMPPCMPPCWAVAPGGRGASRVWSGCRSRGRGGRCSRGARRGCGCGCGRGGGGGGGWLPLTARGCRWSRWIPWSCGRWIPGRSPLVLAWRMRCSPSSGSRSRSRGGGAGGGGGGGAGPARGVILRVAGGGGGGGCVADTARGVGGGVLGVVQGWLSGDGL